jgi:hypothetical protein
MQLNVAIVAGHQVAPDSDEALAAANAAAARHAATWTTPTFVRESDGAEAGLDLADGTRLLHYTVDAVPKSDKPDAAGIITTSNVAPALLPPHVA